MTELDRAPGEPDLTWCREAVQDVSRTFALTVDLLEEPMATRICLGYLLCRVADTVEDANHIPPGEQTALLETYRSAIDPDADTTIEEFRADVEEPLPPADQRSDDWRVVASAPTVVATFRDLPADVRSEIRPPVREMVGGMATFVERYADEGGLRLGDRAELEEYCYYAAGTVGNLITNLLAHDDLSDDRTRTLQETAEQFGQLLQLVNISKDVYDDYAEENNVYLPAEWLAAEGVEQDAVVAAENREPAARVVERTADHARALLDDAQRYLEAMPLSQGNTLAAWSVPYLLAVGTLRELDERSADALTDTDVKVSRQEVFAVTQAATSTGRHALADLREAVAREPYHKVDAAAD